MIDNFSRSSDEGAILRAGEPTEEQVSAIRSRVARGEIDAEMLYVVPAEMSNTLIDSYCTWMTQTSLKNFAANVNAPGGRPATMHHMTHWGAPVGKWFAAVVEERAAAPKQRASDSVYARDFFERAPDTEQAVVETAFLTRKDSNLELIQDLDSGVIDRVSVGATVRLKDAPGSDLICDITNRSLFGRHGQERSEYMPGVVYQIGDDAIMATARYDKAVQREGAFVTLAGNEFATIRRGEPDDEDAMRARQLVYGFDALLVRHAQWLLREGKGQMGSEDVRRLEEVYGAHIVPGRSYHYGDDVGPSEGNVGRQTASEEPSHSASDDKSDAPDAAQDTRSDTMADEATALDAVRDFLGEDLSADLERYRADERGEWEMAARLLTAELAKATKEVAEAERRASEQDAVVRKGLGLADGEDLATGFERIERERAYGREARQAVMDDWAAAFIRAYDIAEDGFDRKAEEALRAGWTTAQVEAETARLVKLAGKNLEPGTTAKRTVDDVTGDDNADEETPRRSPAFAGLTRA